MFLLTARGKIVVKQDYWGLQLPVGLKLDWSYLLEYNIDSLKFIWKLYELNQCHISGLVQERCNSIANALKLHLSFINPSTWPRSQEVNCHRHLTTFISFLISRTTILALVAVFPNHNYRKTPNISRTSVANKIFDNSDVVGASPVGAAPTTSSFST